MSSFNIYCLLMPHSILCSGEKANQVMISQTLQFNVYMCVCVCVCVDGVALRNKYMYNI